MIIKIRCLKVLILNRELVGIIIAIIIITNTQ